MEGKKKIKCSYGILVIVLFAVVCFLTDYILIDRNLNEGKGVTDCVSNSVVDKEDNDTNASDNNLVMSEDSYPKVDLSYYNRENLRINGNEVELDEQCNGISGITVYNGMVFFEQVLPGSSELSIADSEGKILNTYSAYEISQVPSTLKNYSIKNNTIYVEINISEINNVSNRACELQSQGKEEDVILVYQAKYLGNNKFSDFSLDRSISSSQYIIENNINCEG